MTFLFNCYDKFVIPNGFKVHCSLDLDIDMEFKNKCSKILEDASLRIMDIVIKGCKVKVSDLEDEEKRCYVDLNTEGGNLFSVAEENKKMWYPVEHGKIDLVKNKKK